MLLEKFGQGWSSTLYICSVCRYVLFGPCDAMRRCSGIGFPKQATTMGVKVIALEIVGNVFGIWVGE